LFGPVTNGVSASADEIKRRVLAICQHYGITQ